MTLCNHEPGYSPHVKSPQPHGHIMHWRSSHGLKTQGSKAQLIGKVQDGQPVNKTKVGII